MKNKKNILFKYLPGIEIESLDFQVGVDIGLSDNDWDTRGKDITIENSSKAFGYSGETEKIEIDRLIKILNDFKSKGATHTEIMSHCDHRGFVFNPLEIRIAKEKEIKDFKEEMAKKEKDIRKYLKKDLLKKLEKLN